MNHESVIPPASPESEMSILGAVLQENSVLGQAQEIVTASSFYRQAHRHVFEAMCSLDDRSEPIDEITLAEELKRKNKLDEVGGSAFLYALSDAAPIAANVVYYCRIVEQKSAERTLIANASEAVRMVYQGGDFDAAVTKLEAAMPSADRESNAPVGMTQTVKEMIDRVQYRHKHRGEIHGLPYGIHDLDKATLGMHAGELIIIAGRPSMGKSALAGNVMASACKRGKTGMLFTLEMGRVDITDRMAAAYGVKYQNIRSGLMEQMDWVKLKKAAEEIQGWGLVIDDTAAISLRELRAKAKRQKRKAGLDLIVIDYLQLMSLPDPRMSRTLGIGEISRGLKQLAKELGIPVIALSQLNRGLEQRNDKRPMMSDLRDSGEIEQDADVIIFPYRPAAYCEKCRDKVDDAEHDYKSHQSKAEIIIEKQRAGERNLSIPAVWLGEFQRFESANRYDDFPD